MAEKNKTVLMKVKVKVPGVYTDYESNGMAMTPEEARKMKELVGQAAGGDLPFFTMETKDGEMIFGEDILPQCIFTVKEQVVE